MATQQKARYTLIKGQITIRNPDLPRQGPQPDGDTVTFVPDSLDLVRGLRLISGMPPNIRNGRVNVRYEGVDALETHFGSFHQDLPFARAARDRNLAQLGFKKVTFFADLPNVIESVSKNPLPAHVLANGIEANGRLLGLVYAGRNNKADGSTVFVDDALLNKSVNADLVRQGLAYVEPYDSMPMELVTQLRKLVGRARSTRSGLLAQESITTKKSALLRNIDDLQALVMWPKLFRRLATYFAEGQVGLAGFDAWIRADQVQVSRDDRLRLPNGETGNLHDTYAVVGNRLQLRFQPEDLLITPDPKPATP
jgi:endonuclease YncB( thermonuclease family)